MTAHLKPFDITQADALAEAAAKDRHAVLAPTHTVWKDGELIGYVSINACPTAHWWMHTQKAKARDSVHIRNEVDRIMREQGMKYYLSPVGKQSPFRRLMSKFGFVKYAETCLFLRELEDPQ